MRVKIFMDFWNFQLAWNEYHRNQGVAGVVRIPWQDVLPEVLVGLLGDDAIYGGTHVYASVDPRSEPDRRLTAFLNVMDGFRGYSVMVKERRARGAFKCSNDACRKPIEVCPHCGERITRTIEKGVDAALVIDLIQLAIDDVYDHALLVSGDADFAPAVKFLQARMKQVTQ